MATELTASLPSIDTELSKAESEQTSVLYAESKYAYVPPITKDGLTTETHEYLTPKGERGYQVIFRAEVDKVRYVKSVGYGVESKSRTSDWCVVDDG